MKALLALVAIAAAVVLAPAATASPAMCGNHVEHSDASFGNASTDPDGTYVTACGGDSGPDAFGNNATAPSVDTSAHQ